MKFIDHTGHIFELPSYDVHPTGYEYETLDYVFNFKDDYNQRLSVNNFYIKPIRIIIDKHEQLKDINIKVDSNVFALISPKIIQSRIEDNGLIFEIDEDLFTNELSIDDLTILEDSDYNMIPFYGVCYTDEPVSWSSNILIKVIYTDHEEYCPICFQATFYDEQEELIINGKNMGIELPKDIIRAVYRGSMFNDVINEDLYNEKVKEYLLNYMKLHGEIGNTNEAINGLKFFGWGDKINLTKLVKTDNEFIAQYIRDNISINNDLLYRFEHFNTSGLLSVSVPINAETGEYNEQNFDNNFWGEGKPILEDLFNKLISVTYDEGDINFYRPYFDYTFTELGLKLSVLKHFYEKYFLPMHSMLQSASLAHQVHLPDIKYYVKDWTKITEVPMLLEKRYGTQEVIFPDQSIQYIYTQEHIIDEGLHEFGIYLTEGNTLEDQLYYVNELCVSIPIKFVSTDIDYFDCHFVLERNGRTLFESDTKFSNEEFDSYRNFVIIPKLINDVRSINYWDNKKYNLHVLCNGKWYTYTFEIRVPELHLDFGKLRYKYNYDMFRQVKSISDDKVDFNAYMHMPSLVDVSNINFPQNVIDYTNDEVLSKFVNMYSEHPNIPHPGMSGTLSSRYYNRVHHYVLQKRVVEGDEEYWVNVPYEEYLPEEHNKQSMEQIVPMYRQFFDNNGNVRRRFIKNVGGLDFDFYLMHDAVDKSLYLPLQEPNKKDWVPSWYVVLISRQTIDDIFDDSDLKEPDFGLFMINGNECRLKHIGSDIKWLINRMEYVPSNGINQFDKDDIIAGTINNVDLPFILTDGTHWDIVPFSLRMEEDAHVTSTTNTFLMSLGGDNIGYEPGYYNIVVRYSLDGDSQSTREHRARIMIKKN